MENEYINEEDGIKSVVTNYSNGGFAVSVWDTDANESLGCSKVFPDEGDAHTYAKVCAGLEIMEEPDYIFI